MGAIPSAAKVMTLALGEKTFHQQTTQCMHQESDEQTSLFAEYRSRCFFVTHGCEHGNRSAPGLAAFMPSLDGVAC